MNAVANLSGILSVIAPVFILAAIGVYWARAKLPYDGSFVTTFTVNVSTPCLVFTSLSKLSAEGDGALSMALSSAGVMAMGAIGGAAILALCRLPLRPYVPALAFPNAGNMGIPVCLFAFGEAGMVYAVVFFSTMSVLQFSLGPAMAAGVTDVKRLLKAPMIYAVAAALILNRSGLGAPLWLTNTTSLIGACTVPLLLLALGIALASLRPGGLARAFFISLLRFGLGISAGLIMAEILGLEGMMRGVVLVQSSMPVAVFNYLWALRYNNAPQDVAGAVIVSTALSFATIPLILLLLPYM
ncbi:AEC family transporter [Azospirillum sp. SYSU D00513]|uniref:AEC family transporter n=1 Tax=Azospirillum sp. SYSU D00513 TaxID=2812561 RepID=UPI001A9774BA|nr:AEC family transporter [Azospirillum sp. SYSU D00513]